MMLTYPEVPKKVRNVLVKLTNEWDKDETVSTFIKEVMGIDIFNFYPHERYDGVFGLLIEWTLEHKNASGFCYMWDLDSLNYIPMKREEFERKIIEYMDKQ